MSIVVHDNLAYASHEDIGAQFSHDQSIELKSSSALQQETELKPNGAQCGDKHDTHQLSGDGEEDLHHGLDTSKY